MKELVSMDFGNTLYRKNGDVVGFGTIRSDGVCTKLNATGLAFLQIINLMKNGKIFLINSGTYDGKVLRQILNDLKHIYEYSLIQSIPFGNDKEVLKLIENNLYISTFEGRKIVRLKYDGEFKQEIVDEKVVNLKEFFNKIKQNKNDLGISYTVAIKGDDRWHSNYENINENLKDCEFKNAHIITLVFDNVSKLKEFKCNFNLENLEIVEESEKDLFMAYSRKCCKESAVVELANRLSIPLKNCIHFGDEEVDICKNIDYKILNKNSSNNKDLLEAELKSL